MSAKRKCPQQPATRKVTMKESDQTEGIEGGLPIRPSWTVDSFVEAVMLATYGSDQPKDEDEDETYSLAEEFSG